MDSKRLFIFDWDGTLLDSTGKIIRCMHLAITDLGLEPRSDAAVKGIIGLGLPEAIRQLYPDITARDLDSLRNGYSKHFIEADATPCIFYPGVEQVLASLKSDGHLLSVATGKSRRGLNRVLTNLEMADYFDATRCADETASKPHPRMLNELIEELDVDRSRAVMVGDTAFDLEMASNAGVDSIAVSYGAHDRERLLACDPLRCIDDFTELLAWLQQQ